MPFYVYFFCIFIFFSNASANQLVIDTDSDTWQQDVHKTFTQSFVLETLTYSADVYFEQDEFIYLTDLHEGSVVTNNELERALFYLMQKNKFKKIIIRAEQGAQGLHVHFDLIGLWTFAQLKIKGVLVGKDVYKQHYILERGDPFDRIKHKHSLIKIKDALHAQGYRRAQVASDLSYDQDTKSVTVTVFIDTKKRFSIGTVQCSMTFDDKVDGDDADLLQQTVYKKFLRNLVHKSYVKELLNERGKEIKKFLSRKGFLHATIGLTEVVDDYNKKIHLHLAVTVHNKRNFIFLGNQFFSHNMLLDHILQFGRSAWLLPASILAEEIVRAYHDKGFWDVNVATKEEDNRYFFIIHEGVRARINAVEIANAHHILSKRLIKKCCTKLLRTKYFDTHLLRETLDAIIHFYHKRGFLDARIIDHNVTLRDAAHVYVLTIAIEEGQRRKIKEIKVKNYPELAMHEQLRVKKNQPFTTDIVSKQRAWLSDYFQKKGYVHVVIIPDINYDANNYVTIEWKVEKGKKSYFGKTVVHGSSTFPFAYIMRELQYNDGDVWDQKKIRSSFVKLKDLELFDAIHMRPSYAHAPYQEKPIVLKLHKDDPYEVRVRGGFGLQQIYQYRTFAGLTYKAGGSFIVKNPTNTGDQLRFDLDFMRGHRELVLKYRRPWFFRFPVRTEFQAYGIEHGQPGFIGSDQNIYCVKQKGFLLNLRRAWPQLNFGCNVGFEWMETTICHAAKGLALKVARAINFKPTLLDVTVPFIFAEPTVILDYLDNSLNPTRGSFTLVSLKGMFPLKEKMANSYFVKFLVEQSFFAPLRSVVGAVRVRFGHIFHREFNAIMPTERFYLGGAQSVRSYDTDFAPPLGFFLDKECKKQVVPRGGKTMVNMNLELRLPLFKDKMGCVVFQDLGLLSSDNFADFRREHILGATGFGLRFYTPVGPIRFDIGWKWRTIEKVERSYAWFLTLGQAF